ncbi:hypothetical protein ACFOTA_16550 [Chitinophaga sp. GCM10012297]|uniref:Uncharacterized protein n=1 Tax=Chitinophaga chungangae TaxID=2821488 RepID=A0ABS3YGN7_9BACT|nr:hypothetical protein [Chitinophaga chungangae]MBO9153832.1 hypothetical protein [Chitinophaga chungangae]
MDTRETLAPGGSFYGKVMELYQNKQEASILYEDNGVTRANGIITSVFEKDNKHWMQLNGNLDVAIDSLYALNGTFTSDYSEC